MLSGVVLEERKRFRVFLVNPPQMDILAKALMSAGTEVVVTRLVPATVSALSMMEVDEPDGTTVVILAKAIEPVAKTLADLLGLTRLL